MFYLIESVLLFSLSLVFFSSLSGIVFREACDRDVHEDRVPRGWKWGEKRLLNLTVINGNIDGFVSRSRENPPPPPPLLFQWTEKKKGIWITRRWHIVTRGHVSSRYSSTAEEERT